jgi:hypothetical protein
VGLVICLARSLPESKIDERERCAGSEGVGFLGIKTNEPLYRRWVVSLQCVSGGKVWFFGHFSTAWDLRPNYLLSSLLNKVAYVVDRYIPARHGA